MERRASGGRRRRQPAARADAAASSSRGPLDPQLTSSAAPGSRPPGFDPSEPISGGAPSELTRLRTVLEHTSALIGLFAADGTCLYMTPASARQAGVSPSGLVTQSLGPNEVPAEARAWIGAIQAQLPADPRPASGEVSMDTPAGPRAYEFRATPLPARLATDGPAGGWVITAWDVSGRVAAERRATQLEREYAILAEINQAIIRATDAAAMLEQACSIAVEMGRFRLALVAAVPPGSSELRVLAHAGLAGRDLLAAPLPIDPQTGAGAGVVGRAVREQRPVVVADLALDPGMAIWRSVLARHGFRSAAAFPIRLPDGGAAALALYSGEVDAFGDVEIRLFSELAGDLAFALEAIEGRRRRASAEAALRESERRYRELFEKNPQPMWIFDVATLRFLAVNDAAIQAYGYERAEFLAMTIKDIRPPEDVERLLADVESARPELRPIGEWRHLRRDGSVLHVEVTAHDIDWLGTRARLVLVTDVTQRRELEARLAQAARMEAVGHLAGGIAHDFNNLLTAVNGYADILLTEITDEEQREELWQIRRAGARAADLTRQILAFARRQILQPRPIDLNDVVNGVVPLIRRLLGEQIRLETSFAPTPVIVNADRGQLEQVLVNLAVNAADAMRTGGRLTIGTQLLADATSLGRSVSGPAVLLTVADTGVGMDAATLEHIFEPFFTTKPIGEGTGLGLATVHGIVSQSGGEVWADSRPDEGSTFSVLLPVSTGLPEGVPAGRAAAAHQPGDATVLVVEDEQAVRALTVATLERAGYRVFVAQSPAQAAVLAEGLDEPIDLLLTDLIMPGGSGRDLAARLRTTRPELRVVVMSGYDDTSSPRVTGETFLAKPFGPDELLSTVERAAPPRAER